MRNAEPRASTPERRRLVAVCCIVVTLGAAACGKKGPPLAPLNLVPERPTAITARVVDGTVYVQTAVPKKNANGPGPVTIDRVDLYAITIAARAVPPADREFLKPAHAVGHIAVKPPPDPDAEIDEAEPRPKDERPGPGDPITFTEKLTPNVVEPEITPATPRAGEAAAAYVLELPAVAVPSSPDAVAAGGASVATSGGAGLPAGPPNGIETAFVGELPQTGALTLPGTPASPAPATTESPTLKITSRIYAARGVARSGRPGPRSTQLIVPFVPPPPAPPAPAATFTESAVSVTWTAPEPEKTATAGAAPPAPVRLKYNVYDAAAAATPNPLNAQPIDGTTFDRPGLEIGVERCFVVRSVRVEGNVAIESPASPSACVTPRDIFAPAAPKALAAVAGAGAINLIWDANTEPDLAGYLVLRGDGPDGTLQPLTPQPIRETRYADTSAKPGAQYVYVVVAVDKSGNRSGDSNRVTETGR